MARFLYFICYLCIRHVLIFLLYARNISEEIKQLKKQRIK